MLVMRPDGDGVARGGGGEARAEGAGNIDGGGGARDDTDSDEEHFDIALAASHSVSTLLFSTAFPFLNP